MEPAVRVDRLSKTFRVDFWSKQVRAVEDASFEVRPGEIFGLLGPNGAGKTTTIKILLGFVRPSSGKAFVAGHEAGTVEARRHLGYLPENPALYEFLRGDEFLQLSGKLSGLTTTEARERADKLLDLVGLKGRADRPIRRFSKGMVQRLGLAQALVGDPRIVILDEPMSGLDPIGRKDVRDIIFRLREEGRTVVFSTHILSDVEAVCDRIAIMVGGKVTDCGALSELLTPGVRAVEVVAQDVPDALVASLQQGGASAMRRDANVILSFADPVQAQASVVTLSQAGAKLVSVQPHRHTLEDLFVRRAQGAARP
jgi:ABC-2 type transport system ATP-binding protein